MKKSIKLSRKLISKRNSRRSKKIVSKRNSRRSKKIVTKTTKKSKRRSYFYMDVDDDFLPLPDGPVRLTRQRAIGPDNDNLQTFRTRSRSNSPIRERLIPEMRTMIPHPQIRKSQRKRCKRSKGSCYRH